MAVPIRVGEHDVRSAVRAILIAGVEQTAKDTGRKSKSRDHFLAARLRDETFLKEVRVIGRRGNGRAI